MSTTGFQCPLNGWHVAAEYDELTETLSVWPAEFEEEWIEALGERTCEELYAETEKWCARLRRECVEDGIEADEILRDAGVDPSDLFGYIRCALCGSDQGDEDRLCAICRGDLQERTEANLVFRVLERD